MRSRYSAFAIGQGTHLIATLADEHADRKGDTTAIAQELSRAKERQRFLDLAIKHTSEDGDRGEVLFYARIFERGQDRSFVELSTFVKQHGEWRYASGKLVPASGIPGDPRALTKEQLLLLVT
jgi:SEC-C motif-containing protein